ncbi:MAG: FAD-binding protein [Candidatus Falkowbacteria bacterium]
MDNLIRIEEISLDLRDEESLLKDRIAEILALPITEILSYQVVKRAVDSRQKSKVVFVYSVDAQVKDLKVLKTWNPRHRVRLQVPYVYQIKAASPLSKRPIVVGSGPSGLFAALALAKAGLKPLLIERGQNIEARLETVNNFFKSGEFNPQSNIQFGEGGAGTFSDGKLYTLINDPRSHYVFSELVLAGAPEDILTSATPHIGTDKLRDVVKNLRHKITQLGGEVRFETTLSSLEIKDNQIVAAIFNDAERVETKHLILATGHSARDTYAMLYEKEVAMVAKPFAIGLRIEHSREEINKAQYGPSWQHPKLGAAKYKLVEHVMGERSVYTFCMCPGGLVVAAASEVGGVVTNGMSYYSQSGTNSNSALLVPVMPSDFGSDHPLSGIAFQRFWEQKAYEAGGANYQAPAQLVGDFLAGRPSAKLGRIKPTYLPGVKLTSLDSCLPDYVISSLKKALPLMARKISVFADPEALLTGIETRSSSPVRLTRDANCQSNILGLYPCGEGAGYAGGIVSSAIDGLRVAEAIISH